MSPTDPAASELTDPITAELRTTLIGDRVTIEQAAAALRVTPRSVYNAIGRHHIPFVRIFGTRYLEPGALRAALLGEMNATRGRGRPRKAA
jgi:excisionase family DNA binding protein